jgi:predicted RNase H-like nuclease
MEVVWLPECQHWAFEVHPEVCFWALAGKRPMAHKKKTPEGSTERISLLAPIFPEIGHHLGNRPPGVAKDDLLAAAVARTALRLHAKQTAFARQSETRRGWKQRSLNKPDLREIGKSKLGL